MDFIAIMIICFILGMCFQFYVCKAVSKMFRDNPTSSDLDGLKG